jgi:putative oxidoreductase
MKSKLKVGTQWTVQVLLAVVMISVGLAKLTSVDSMVRMFQEIGIGQWLRVVVGAVEVLAGVLMFSNVYSAMGATLILMTMAGAILTHLFIIGGNGIPALVIGLLAALLLALKRSDLVEPRRKSRIEIQPRAR